MLFVVTHHTRLKAFGKIIHDNLNLLYMNDEVKDTFTPGTMASFRTFGKLSSYLLRTSKTFKINHWLTSDDKCLVYLFTCKTCSKQYTGKTTYQFRFCWNDYKSNDRKFKRGEPRTQKHLHEHFYRDGHNVFLEDVVIILIDKTDGRNPRSRKNYWMRTLKTLAPDGLNIEDCVWPNTVYTTYHTI